jgi:FMN phosphatase YigB (HAD superfamily)
MVGNDTFLDLEPANIAGMKTYLIDSPFSANSNGFDPDFRGTLVDLAALINL